MVAYLGYMDETRMNSACPGLVPVPLLQGFKFIGSSKYFYQLPMPFEGAFRGPDHILLRLA